MDAKIGSCKKLVLAIQKNIKFFYEFYAESNKKSKTG